jgi:hypothetical protein
MWRCIFPTGRACSAGYLLALIRSSSPRLEEADVQDVRQADKINEHVRHFFRYLLLSVSRLALLGRQPPKMFHSSEASTDSAMLGSCV